ncbi:MAG: 30S ribosomal protein S15 [Bacillales bacterium]
MITKENKIKLVKEFGKNEKDTGSVEFQIALLTQQIKDLTEHVKNNGKDSIARRGLLIKVGKRKSLLRYLERTNRDSYIEVLSKLGLRK